MSAAKNSLALDDPRDASLESKVTLPKTWYSESNDGSATGTMFAAGLVMMTRNRYLAWPTLLWGINGVINQHPMRTREGGSPWSGMLVSISALVASYMPLLMFTPGAQ